MNIYISKPNEEWLRKQDGTMSGIINAFLDAEREADEDLPVKETGLRLPPAAKKPKSPHVPDTPTYEPIKAVPIEPAPKLRVMTNDDLKELLGGKATPIKDEPRHTCKDTCKHWVWDTNRGGRTNTLTGEFQEGEPW